MTGGNSSSAPSKNFQPTRSGGCRLGGPAKKRVRLSLKPYRGHWKLSTATRRLGGVVTVAWVVVGLVNWRLGCDTLPGALASTYATAPPAMTRTTTATTSPRRSSRRPGGLGMVRHGRRPRHDAPVT